MSTLAPPGAASTPPPADGASESPPNDVVAPAWLYEAGGERATAWVDAHNERTRQEYASSPDFVRLANDLKSVLDCPDRIPAVADRAGMLYNFWTDADHPHGIWRRTSWESYAAGAPSRADRAPAPTSWETLLDLEALNAPGALPAELGCGSGEHLVWGGAHVLTTGPRAGRRALVCLSPGGGDASLTLEYDLDARRLIAPADGGFHRPTSKGTMTWGDDAGESVIVSADFGPGTVSRAGYPRQVRRLRRGQSLDEAEVLVTAGGDAVAAFASRDPWGRTWLTTMPSFQRTRIWLLPDDSDCPAGTGPARAALAGGAPAGTVTTPDGDTVPAGAIPLEVPEDSLAGVGRDWLTIQLRSPWEAGGVTHPAGTLLGAGLADFLAGRRRLEVLFAPSASSTLLSAAWTAGHLVLTVLDDVASRLEVCTPPSPEPAGAGASPASGTKWGHHWIDLTGAADRLGCPAVDDTELRPGRALLSVSAAALRPADTDYLWISASGWTTPSTLAVARLTPSGEITGMAVVRQAPARFDARGVRVSQHQATSADGTRVPYFQIGRPAPSSPPVLVHAYGAFGKSLVPGYEPVTGKAWLERGGTYVVVNTRGGGEYGPGWHLAGAGAGRRRVVEDLTAVLDSLVARGVTTPEDICLYGSSAGGLLTGEVLARCPERIGAAVLEAPLTDMRRYTQLSAGAAWTAEFGDPDDPEQWAWLREHSPLHLLQTGQAYPPVLLLASAADDRVHPAHARALAHRLEQLGQKVTYFETAAGGHGGGTTHAQQAFVSALTHDFARRHTRRGR
ncbi:prolyl oligopeptidase family serine peptidase [Actinomyces glycerinitolerans]|uniref:Peptidase s9a prolyl oligopeptidase n=1 Tax=Actinomyces glycerinitolerans TaxID=1892869 RepID=A0A1M4RYE1_9ACTO|nr:prolyl oligopeptidase family serine peptidase [Actinomyces glycerinitolerans]SHE24993.1 peptidase s9a prolyl oligopeptidase [Actinomyces glycerinitolerans]